MWLYLFHSECHICLPFSISELSIFFNLYSPPPPFLYWHYRLCICIYLFLDFLYLQMSFTGNPFSYNLEWLFSDLFLWTLPIMILCILLYFWYLQMSFTGNPFSYLDCDITIFNLSVIWRKCLEVKPLNINFYIIFFGGTFTVR